MTDSIIEPGSPLDKIIGMIYGHALGGAIGISAENKQAEGKESEPLFPYTEPIGEYEPCQWNEYTDQMIAIAESMVKNDFRIHSCEIADSFSQLQPQCIGEYMERIITTPEFTSDPSAVAVDAWEESNQTYVTNESIANVSIAGIVPNTRTAQSCAVLLTLLTHADPRCRIGSIVHVRIVHDLIYTAGGTPESIDTILEAIINTARDYINQMVQGAYAKQLHNAVSFWIKAGYTRNIAEFSHADDPEYDYVLKTMAVSIHVLKIIRMALQNKGRPSFKKVMMLIASEPLSAFRADCAVAGATLGAHIGYSRLPRDWLDAMPHSCVLDSLITSLVCAIRKVDSTDDTYGSTVSGNKKTQNIGVSNCNQLPDRKEHTPQPTSPAID